MAEQLREVSVTYIGIMAGNWAGAQVRAGQLPQGPRVPGYQAWSPRTMSYLRTRDLRSHLGLLATSCLGLPDMFRDGARRSATPSEMQKRLKLKRKRHVFQNSIVKPMLLVLKILEVVF